MFKSLDGNSLQSLEKENLEFWEQEGIFKKSLENRKKNPSFVFYDGPPFATGLPHYGHLLASTIKDTVARYKTMQGYYVPRTFGWDCHGLPVENEIEKAFDLRGAASIEEFGISRFNEECRSIVLRYSEQWKETITRIGRWVDYEQSYHTMDLPFMESVWWVFQQLYQKDLIYKGFKVMPFSAKLGTPLSNFEANLNYKEVDDPSIVVKFALQEQPHTHLLVWTTTPWTLVSNLAVCVGEDIEYVKVEHKETKERYVLSHNALKRYFKDEAEYTFIETLRAIDLEGLKYIPPFDYFKSEPAFKVLVADFVSDGDGTGLVHAAPGFGEDDFYACKNKDIHPVCPVDNNGRFTSEIPEYEGLFVQEANKDLIKRLKETQKLFHRGTIRHRYPFCWRTDTPLIYRLTSSWFVAVEKFKDKLIEANKKIYWMPDHIKEGRFGKWLEGARDWAISRNRYWGTPLPVWEAEDGERIVVGSLEELKKYTGEKVNDLHRHFIDQLEFKDKKGKVYKRTEEVFDCWFESGSMPYAQSHYPFENPKKWKNNFPADFIAEGLDQTRGWFYTLTVLSTALFDSPAFKNVIVNGIILAEDGQKMSKRLKNYPDPKQLLEDYGADAVRLYLIQSPVVRAEDMRFQKKGVEQVFKQVLLPLWNAHSFFISYAQIYDWDPQKNFEDPTQILDRWIISQFNKLVSQIESAMDRYHLNQAVAPLIEFIDELTNWYIRRSRRRFWKNEASKDRDEAFSTLYTVLVGLCRVSAPFMPFLSEGLYRNLSMPSMAESVHLCDFPVPNPQYRNKALEQQMSALQNTVSQGHALRKEHKIKVRQPLSILHLAVGEAIEKEFLEDQVHLIQEELNVKEVVFHENEKELVTLTVIPNFRTLGKKVGPLMKEVQKVLQNLSNEQIKKLTDQEAIQLRVQDEEIEIAPEDIQFKREVKQNRIASNSGSITIALDLELTPELIQEGLARELINKIQMMRRDQDFLITDRIYLNIKGSEKIKEAYLAFQDYIQEEVLATKVLFKDSLNGTEWDLNGEMTEIVIEKDESYIQEEKQSPKVNQS